MQTSQRIGQNVFHTTMELQRAHVHLLPMLMPTTHAELDVASELQVQQAVAVAGHYTYTKGYPNRGKKNTNLRVGDLGAEMSCCQIARMAALSAATVAFASSCKCKQTQNAVRSQIQG